MREHIVLPATALLLKDAGFNEPTQAFYDNAEGLNQPSFQILDNVMYVYKIEERHQRDVLPESLEILTGDKLLAPTQTLAQKWLRENFRIYIQPKVICATSPDFTFTAYSYHAGSTDLHWQNLLDSRPVGYANFEEAFEAGIAKGLEELKERKEAKEYIESL